jgi:hypothetical protein
LAPAATSGMSSGVGTAADASSTTTAGTGAEAAAGTAAGTGADVGGATVLRNPRSGQIFSWNGSGWQESGHVGLSAGVTYDTTNWNGGTGGQSSRGYGGRSLAGLAAWRAGHMIGTTMRLVGMGKES